MPRKRYIKKPSKYADQVIVAENYEIIKIDYQNTEINEKLKTVFYVPTASKPDGMMCIAWGRTVFEIGDTISMKGRLKDGVFLVWNYLIMRRKEKEGAANG